MRVDFLYRCCGVKRQEVHQLRTPSNLLEIC